MNLITNNINANHEKSAPIVLYRNPKSGHCHKVELFLSLLNLRYINNDVDMVNAAHKSASFIEKNSLGQVPVIVDGDHTLSDSNAILIYLAKTYSTLEKWTGTTAFENANVQRWLSIAAGELARGPAALRLEYVFGASIDVPSALAISKILLDVMEKTLSNQNNYLVANTLTLADIAMYSYIAHAPEGGVSLQPYPAIRSWIDNIESTENFIPMPASTITETRL